MDTTDLSISDEARLLIAHALGADDLHVAADRPNADFVVDLLDDYDTQARARFALMRPDEREVFYLLAEGTSVAELADIMGIDPVAAEHYRATVFRKMDLGSIIDLAVVASILGFGDESQRADDDQSTARAA